MNEQEIQCENYGYEMPNELKDISWRKCFEYQVENKLIIKEGIIKIRKYISQEAQTEYLINVILQTEIHKTLFKYAKKLLEKIITKKFDEDDVTCLHEIIWIFVNLCSGSQKTTKKILELDIINFCKEVFNLEGMGNIILILFELIGNLAGEQNLNIKLGFLADPKFFSFMNNSYCNYIDYQNFHVEASWSFKNLFRNIDLCGNKNHGFNLEEIIFAYYPIINTLLQINNDQEAIKNLLQIFRYLSDRENFHMQETFQIIEKFLSDPRESICQFVMQIMGNYIMYSDEAIDYALSYPLFLENVFNFLNHTSKLKFRKNSAWIFSNLLAGNKTQIEKILSIPTVFNRFHQIIGNQENQSVLKELIYSVSNCLTKCSDKSFEIIFESCIIETLSLKLINCKQKASFTAYVDGLSHYIQKIKKNFHLPLNIFAHNLEFINPVLTIIEQKFHQQSETYTKVYIIRQKIEELINITEQEMAKRHFQNFKL